MISGYALNTGAQASKLIQAEPEPISIKPSETALIVVDMQNAYTTIEGYLDLAGFDVSATAPVVKNINSAIELSRKAGIQVVFLQNGWDPQYVEAGGEGSPNWHKSNALKTMRKNPELEGRFLAKGGWDYALVDELTPQEGDWVIPKTRYSGFFNTNLDSMLRARGIRNLVFTGIATNVCVESTLRDGFHLEYFGIALSDATYPAGPPSAHDAALKNISTFFGWVASLEDYQNALSV
ncbi:pyrimidine utilization protein B [Marinomonas ostreistagni]|uniref:Ureidoacrylate amidohydrolase RutB n=1 Tax=Marinomonas ostreistagni TaxID=359209 RepID=A0ABS0ZA40_9GAMM|nr:pyrimidine utilization protein B [Marinomonas ostreistagni]MBJ7550517.1 pyrimidine utilization protein B [Marinomonas ostreistagni]